MVLTFLKAVRLGNTHNLILLIDDAPPGRGSWSTCTTRSDFSSLGGYWTAAKPPSGRAAHHSVGFFKLRRVLLTTISSFFLTVQPPWGGGAVGARWTFNPAHHVFSA